MTCKVCEWIENKELRLFENDDVFVSLYPEPANPGHVVVMPKTHTPILENVPDAVMGKLLNTANGALKAVFDGLGAQGTNIVVQNGVAAGQKHAHVMVHVIPRWEKDGVNLLWSPKQLNEEEMSSVEVKLREATTGMIEKQDVAVAPKKSEEVVVEKVDEDSPAPPDEDYRVKHIFERIP